MKKILLIVLIVLFGCVTKEPDFFHLGVESFNANNLALAKNQFRMVKESDSNYLWAQNYLLKIHYLNLEPPRQKKIEIFGISGDGIELRKGPGLKYEKVLNQKASGILKKNIYASVDYSVKVTEEEINGAWSRIKVVEPSYLSSSHQGWMLTKYIIKGEVKVELKIPLYSIINDLKSTLSQNGIGKLSTWKNDELGWYSFTDYYSFGNSSSVNGMQNNIAYYINGRQKEFANEVKIVLNINNDKETNKALQMLNNISLKTINSLNLEVPQRLAQSILNQKPMQFENDIYQLVLELDKSKIDTWNLLIMSK